MPAEIEYFVANLTGGVRRETRKGREFLVAPVSMLVPGVHNGSRGSLFYSPKVIANSVLAWNGMPLTLKHPIVPGSARTPKVMEEQGIGTVFNVTLEGDKLRGEAWLDIENTSSLDPALISDIENGTKISVSTGLFSATKKTEGVFNGEVYTGEVTGLSPDHLAVLREEEGACSLDDGCGINNSEGEPMTNRSLLEQFQGFVKYLKDGSKSLSTPKPKKEESSMALNAEKKKEAVDSLIANCDCYKEEDRETLNALDDNELVEKVLESNKTQKEALTSNAKKSLEAVTAPIEIDDKTKMVFNAEKNEWEKQIKEEEPVENESKKPMTEKEWLASAPESIRNAFAHSQSLIENERQSLINKIAEAQEDVENARTDLSQKSLDELKTIASFLPEQKTEAPAPNYEGRGSFVGNRGSSADFDPNDTIPVLDFLSAEFDPEQKSA